MKKYFRQIIGFLIRLFRFEPDDDILDDAYECEQSSVMHYIKAGK